MRISIQSTCFEAVIWKIKQGLQNSVDLFSFHNEVNLGGLTGEFYLEGLNLKDPFYTDTINRANYTILFGTISIF